tara:strand:+ start:12259 stop:13695 length:1437 start_codon:yes stop_codon:yes gene_type:complete
MSDLNWQEELLARFGDVARSAASIRGLARTLKISRHKAKWLFENAGRAPSTSKVGREVPEARKENLLHNTKYYFNESTDSYVTFIKSAPKPLVVSGDDHRAMKRAYSNWDGQPASINEICRTFGIPRPWFVEYKSIHGWTHDSEPFSAEELLDRDMDDMVADALQQRRQRIFQKYEVSKWKEIQKAADNWNQFEQTTLKTLLTHMPENRDQTLPDYVRSDAYRAFALVLGLTDFHWGSYSWGGETDSPYNREIAEKRLFSATEILLNYLPHNPSEIVLPIASDFFDVDGDTPSTTKGTPQDVDGTPTEILVTGCQLMVRYIDYLRQISPVKIVMMAGNHDRHNGLALLLYLSAWYRDTPGVEVVMDYKPRVYLQYENNLLGFSHGDGHKTKPKDLAALVPVEAKTIWGATDHHLIFGGHLHHQHVQEIGGITHYLLPSLCGTDRFHTRNGWTAHHHALQGFMVDPDQGVVSTLTARPE